MEISKTRRVTEFNDIANNNWITAGNIKKMRINKQLNTVQFFFEDGRAGEIRSCNPYGDGDGALVVSELVSLANVKRTCADS